MARTDQPDTQPKPQQEVAGTLEFQKECIAFFSELVDVIGVPRSVGQIYGLLFASPAPLRFTDIAEGLAISRGSASQGLHALRTLGAVRTISNGNREFFEPELGLRKLVAGLLRERINPLVEQGGDSLARLRSAADGSTDGRLRKFHVSRVEQLEIWRRQMRLLLPILATILGSRRTG